MDKCCECGGEMHNFSNTEIFPIIVFGKKIEVTITDVPSGKCSGCGNIVYDLALLADIETKIIGKIPANISFKDLGL